MTDTTPPSADQTEHDIALAAFTEYFVRNYPGPDTIIHDPQWHAPKLFRAAESAIYAARAAQPTPQVQGSAKMSFEDMDDLLSGAFETHKFDHRMFTSAQKLHDFGRRVEAKVLRAAGTASQPPAVQGVPAEFTDDAITKIFDDEMERDPGNYMRPGECVIQITTKELIRAARRLLAATPKPTGEQP